MRIEDIPENYLSKVDTLISEPLGVLLVNERMLESYLKARDKLNQFLFFKNLLDFLLRGVKCSLQVRLCILFHSVMNLYIKSK